MSEDNSQLLWIYCQALKFFKKDLTRQEKDLALFEGKILQTLNYCFTYLFDEKRKAFYGSQDADEHYYSLPLSERKKLSSPFVDKTFFTDWNSLMISALLVAGKQFDKKYSETAFQCMDFLLKNCFKKSFVLHFPEKNASKNLLKDYALFLQALIDCYQFSFNAIYLKKSNELANLIKSKFWDSKENGFFDSVSQDSFSLLQVQKKSLNENALMIKNLLKLSFFNESQLARKLAEKTTDAMLSNLSSNEFNFSFTESLLLLENGLNKFKISSQKFSENKEFLQPFIDEILFFYDSSIVLKFDSSLPSKTIIFCKDKKCFSIYSLSELKKLL